MTYDPAELERTWRERWASEGRYEADPTEDDPTFVTVPYPYPSGGMHIGHARTYTVPDVYARYRRQRGDNVLFPIAWHVTGTPIIGAVERLKKGEDAQLEVLKNTYNVPEETLQELETPMGFARHFIEEHYKRGMKALGLSIDWRREFTTNDERYQRFITWQYESLRDRGLLEKGLHPVNFCTNEEQPVTTHDILEGEEAEFQDYTLIKFHNEEAVFPMATLRPETVRGVTNAFVDPKSTYVSAAVDGEQWIVSQEAIEKLDLQDRDIDVAETFAGSDLVGQRVRNPVTDDELVLLPASFVDTDNATGVVMSVPAHSPDDWMALEEAKAAADDLESYGLDPDEVRAIEPRGILTIEGYGEYPAQDAVEEHGVTSSTDPALEEATRELHNREFHQGRLTEEYGEFAGQVIEDVRDDLRAFYRNQGAFDAMYDFTEEVICRCGGDVEVAYQDTWFLRYNDEEWRDKTKRAIDRIDAIPENTRDQYLHTVDWLEEWPCIRNYGLGTRLPWDDDFVIEPLSDSTIYMAYYTIAHRLDAVPVEELTPAFFETLFYGAEAVDDPPAIALELREEWDYWYPVSVRCSGNDLVPNHLTFFLYHHAELFAEEDWPEAITVMGMGLLEGKSMSSSSGHVVLPGEAIETYGADAVRFFLMNAAEPWQDYDWRGEEVHSVRQQLDRFWNRAVEVIDQSGAVEDPMLSRADRWILAKLQETVEEVTSALDQFETRKASQHAFYRFDEHLRWYRRRVDPDAESTRWTEREVLRVRLLLLAPFTPFLSNELYERMTGEHVEAAGWPEPDIDFDDDAVRSEEAIIRQTFEDIRDIIDVTGTDPEVIRLYTAAEWKRDVYETVVANPGNQGAIMGELMQDEKMRERGNEVNQLVQTLVEQTRGQDVERVETRLAVEERAILEDASGFFGDAFDASIDVYAEDDSEVIDPGDKRSEAIPYRPAIHIE